MFAELPVRRQPVLERSCPTDDQIVYQWPCRECGRRPYVSAQCDSPSGAAGGFASDSPAKCPVAQGIRRISEYFFCRGQPELRGSGALFLRTDQASRLAAAQWCASSCFSWKLCTPALSGAADPSVWKLSLRIGRFLPRCPKTGRSHPLD